MNILQICPPHLSEVATLPWEIQKRDRKEKGEKGKKRREAKKQTELRGLKKNC